MKRKFLLPAVALSSLMLATFAYVGLGPFTEPSALREPDSLPNTYESLSACEKQEILWQKTIETTYKEWPGYKSKLQVVGLSMQAIGTKRDHYSDFAPSGWKKFLHARAALAKVKIIPRSSYYSGLFQSGADCALLRLSLTFKPSPVAPGLALKVLRDNIYSANVSALVSLGGQEKDYNFFANPMSNIVPIGTDLGQKWVHNIFSKVSQYPEELGVHDMATIDKNGHRAEQTVSPRQLFFIPDSGLRFSSSPHDVREDFVRIPEGTVIYRLHAAPPKYNDYDYANYKLDDINSFVSSSEHIADIVTTSEFIVSEFGDDGIFFRHQVRR